MRFVLVMVVIVFHAHHFRELLEGQQAVAIFVEHTDHVFAGRHVAILVHRIEVFNEVFQFIEGETTAAVSIGFVEHGHQRVHHVFFDGFLQGAVVVVVVFVFCVLASPASVRKFFALFIRVTIAPKIVGSIVIRVPLIEPTFVIIVVIVSTMVVVIDVVSGAFPTAVRELLAFVIPVTVGILRRSVTVFIPCVIPACIRT